MSVNATSKFDNLRQKYDFLFVIYYRGHWCPFCMAYLRVLQDLSPTITAAGGCPVIVSAQDEEHLSEVRSSSGYTGEAINDPENTLTKRLAADGIVTVAITEWQEYPHGLAQPAILVIKKDGSIVETWAIVPSEMNLGGAKDRPDLHQVWENINVKLNDKQPSHARFSNQRELDDLAKELGVETRE
ncbi:AhpC-TSA domain-containing protein [Trichoderma simmonsii]|uniref:AhpC-TSA domain-containing protein n=1 Tax=Trichoderma simmonsii TaxID=1491479 RepID=A0A8G0PEV0_9HYPO|nr:AhpC-TSA domain-containing protein [Trichoderma simmonsii]